VNGIGLPNGWMLELQMCKRARSIGVKLHYKNYPKMVLIISTYAGLHIIGLRLH